MKRSMALITRSVRLIAVLILALLFCLTSIGQAFSSAQGDAGQPQLIKDINTRISDGSSIWCTMKAWGKLFLLASDGVNGLVLMASDGTQAGTFPIKVIAPSNISEASWCSQGYAVMGDSLFFDANDGVHGDQLWKTDGTADGTIRLTDFSPGGVQSLTAVADQVYFLARTVSGSLNSDLFRTDGTSEGTQAVKNENDQSYGANRILGAFNGGLYVKYTYRDFNWNLQTAKSCIVLSIDGMCYYPESPSGTLGLGQFNGKVFYQGAYNVNGLWTWDALDGAQLIKADLTKLDNFYESDPWIYFMADDGVHGSEWWRTDGLVGGTTELVADLIPDGALRLDSSLPPVPFGEGGLLFTASNDYKPRIIQPGTVTIVDALPLSPPYPFYNATSLGNSLLIEPASSLWVTDGTPESAVQLAPPAPPEVFVDALERGAWTELNGQVYFSHWDSEHGYELWQSDGSLDGTHLAVDVNQVAGSSFPGELILANQKLFFTTHEKEKNWFDLWVSDGIPGGETYQIADTIDIAATVPVGGVGGIYFGRYMGSGWPKLWFSDGTLSGTGLVKEEATGLDVEINAPYDANIAGGKTLFFWGAYPSQLWKTSAPDSGAVKVSDQVFSVAPIGVLGNLAIFTQGREFDVCDLYRSDGTEAGTYRISTTIFYDFESFFDIFCGSGQVFYQANQRLFFTQSTDSYGMQLAQTDGTPDGTMRLTRIAGSPLLEISNQMATMRDTLYMIAKSDQGWGLWKTRGVDVDGIELVMPFPLANDNNHPDGLVGGADEVYFVDSSTDPQQIWISDGTTAGTRAVEGTYTAPGDLIAAGSRLFFMAENIPGENPPTGRELWMANATSGEATLVADLNPGPVGSDPRLTTYYWLGKIMAVSGTRLYFSATDGQPDGYGVGAELWMYDFATSRVFLPAVWR